MSLTQGLSGSGFALEKPVNADALIEAIGDIIENLESEHTTHAKKVRWGWCRPDGTPLGWRHWTRTEPWPTR